MIALIDCNNFYASCEQVLRPDLKRKPIVILSNNDGCVISRSQAAKDLGIKMGIPFFKAREEFKKKGVVVFSSNYTLYGDMSARVIECIDRFSNEVEVYSVDEAFTRLAHKTEKAKQQAITMREHIYNWVGIPVKIGVAPSKTLAKLAAKQAKKTKEGVFIMHTPQQIKTYTQQTPIEKVWGVGRGVYRFLANHHIETAWQFSQLHDTFIRKHLGVVGLRMAYELRGLACLPLLQQAKAKKNIMVSRSFSHPITTIEQLREAVSSYVHECARKLRGEKLTAEQLTIFLRTYEHRSHEPQHNVEQHVVLPTATNNTILLNKMACQLAESLYKPGFKYKKAGVLLSSLKPQEHQQFSLFTPCDKPTDRQLTNTIDQLNNRYGKRSVRLASSGIKRSWKMSVKYRSNRFTTRWNEIATI